MRGIASAVFLVCLGAGAPGVKVYRPDTHSKEDVENELKAAKSDFSFAKLRGVG